MQKQFKVILQFKPTNQSPGDGWGNVMRFTTRGGAEFLAVYYNARFRGGLLEVSSEFVDHQYSYIRVPSIGMGKWHNIVIVQRQVGRTFTYKVNVNGRTVRNITNTYARTFKDVKVHVSYPWYKTQPGLVRNVYIFMKEDGGWSAWSTFTSCSRSCSGGVQSRSRNCTNPAPINGGQDCSGSMTETTSCNIHLCPVHGGISPWSALTPCTRSCGVGFQSHSRTCTNPPPSNGGRPCTETLSETKDCNAQPCPGHGGWTSWSKFTSCTRSCSGGIQSRTRACTNPPPSNRGRYCSGSETETTACNVQSCANKLSSDDGAWTSWSAYSPCDRPCSGGMQYRSRTCTNPPPTNTGSDCDGNVLETKSCNTQPCQDAGIWGSWSAFTSCSKSCGGGMRFRRRKCIGRRCRGRTSDFIICNTDACSGGFYDCDPPCENNGICIGPGMCRCQKGYIGETCEIVNAVAGVFSSWSAYTPCSRSCGAGEQVRSRTCTRQLSSGTECRGRLKEIKLCNVHLCPTDASDNCNPPCKNNGRCMSPGACRCKVGYSGEICDIVHGGWSSWNPLTSCSKSCNGGIQSRSRTCTNPAPSNGGRHCSGSMTDTESCNTQSCPVDGGWASWGVFASCSRSCSGGTQSRSRTCTNPTPSSGGRQCPGSLTEARSCNMEDCIVHGGWSSWNTLAPCSKSCGSGSQSRSRTCTNPAPSNGGRHCSGSITYTESCNTQSCPVDGGWSSWSVFTSCSRSCAGGIKSHYRTCTNPTPANGGRRCSGSHTGTESCNMEDCIDKESRAKAIRAKSRNWNTPFTARFRNKNKRPVLLFWKSYKGNTKFVKTIAPGSVYVLKTYFTHPFFAAYKGSTQLHYFSCCGGRKYDFVFEGGRFGAAYGSEVDVDIMSRQYGDEIAKQARSVTSTIPFTVNFRNRNRETVKVYWKDFKGKTKFLINIPSGRSYREETYVSHPFIAVNTRNGELQYFTGRQRKRHDVVFEGSKYGITKKSYIILDIVSSYYAGSIPWVYKSNEAII